MKDIDKKATVIEEKLMELEEIGYKIPMSSLLDSAIRHISCYMRGMDDEPHLVAAMWNIAFAIWTEKNKPEMQDIPTRRGNYGNK